MVLFFFSNGGGLTEVIFCFIGEDRDSVLAGVCMDLNEKG